MKKQPTLILSIIIIIFIFESIYFFIKNKIGILDFILQILILLYFLFFVIINVGDKIKPRKLFVKYEKLISTIFLITILPTLWILVNYSFVENIFPFSQKIWALITLAVAVLFYILFRFAKKRDN